LYQPTGHRRPDFGARRRPAVWSGCLDPAGLTGGAAGFLVRGAASGGAARLLLMRARALTEMTKDIMSAMKGSVGMTVNRKPPSGRPARTTMWVLASIRDSADDA
jgi:hypothetical protein